MKRNKTSTAWIRNALAIGVCGLTLSANGQPTQDQYPPSSNNNNPGIEIETDAYANPNSGNRVALRPSSKGKQIELKETFAIELRNPTVQVLLDKKTARFEVIRIASDKSELITLSGPFSDQKSAWLTDEGAVDGQHRMKGLAYCLESTEERIDCSGMFVEIYFYHAGVLIKSQFANTH